MELSVKVIAHIHSDFPTKFGIPRQSGLVDSLRAAVVFEPEYRKLDALRGLESFSHIWLIWQFSQSARDSWSPTVRPPRLGGNARMGVFATRSPFRPSPIGLSAVRLIGIEPTQKQGATLLVAGADLMDGTPILDIKPYLPYTDSHPEALGGFAATQPGAELSVQFPPALLEQIPSEKREALYAILADDPRPRYQRNPSRIYGLSFAGFDIRFTVRGEELTVQEVLREKSH